MEDTNIFKGQYKRMSKQGRKKLSGVARLPTGGFRSRGPDSAEKYALVFPEEMEAAKQALRSGGASTDPVADLAARTITAELQTQQVRNLDDPGRDVVDAYDESASRVMTSARAVEPRQGRQLVVTMSNELDNVRPENDDQRDRIQSIQEKLAVSFSEIAPDDALLSPGISTARQHREELQQKIDQLPENPRARALAFTTPERSTSAVINSPLQEVGSFQQLIPTWNFNLWGQQQEDNGGPSDLVENIEAAEATVELCGVGMPRAPPRRPLAVERI
jgi:hypothetical protein